MIQQTEKSRRIAKEKNHEGFIQCGCAVGSFGRVWCIGAGRKFERPMAMYGAVSRPAGRLCLHHAKWLGS
jgi:hypothetical protein